MMRRRFSLIPLVLLIAASSLLIAATLQTLTITPGSRMLVSGTQYQFRAWGAYSDGTTREIPAEEIEWSVSNGELASIDTPGMLDLTGLGDFWVYAHSAGVHTSSGIRALSGGDAFPEANRPITIVVTWKPNQEEDLAWYNVYFGYDPDRYHYMTSTAETTATITGVAKGTRFFIGVSAVDHAGNESSLSGVKVGVPDGEYARNSGSCGGGEMR